MGPGCETELKRARTELKAKLMEQNRRNVDGGEQQWMNQPEVMQEGVGVRSQDREHVWEYSTEGGAGRQISRLHTTVQGQEREAKDETNYIPAEFQQTTLSR